MAHPVNDEEVARLISEAAQFDTTADQADAITFSAWDFGGQRVFYALHHAFLSRYGCYVLVFRMDAMMLDGRRGECLAYVRNWLRSVSLHAKGAPVILVGTHKDAVGAASD